MSCPHPHPRADPDAEAATAASVAWKPKLGKAAAESQCRWGWDPDCLGHQDHLCVMDGRRKARRGLCSPNCAPGGVPKVHNPSTVIVPECVWSLPPSPRTSSAYTVGFSILQVPVLLTALQSPRCLLSGGWGKPPGPRALLPPLLGGREAAPWEGLSIQL